MSYTKISNIKKLCDDNATRTKGGMNLPDIKAQLKTEGLSASGTRDVLKARLCNHYEANAKTGTTVKKIKIKKIKKIKKIIPVDVDAAAAAVAVTKPIPLAQLYPHIREACSDKDNEKLTVADLNTLVSENYPDFSTAGLSRERLLDKVCSGICPSTEFVGAPNLLEHFNPIPDAEGKYELNGQKATVTKKVKIASGTEGTVFELELTTSDSNKALLAVKTAFDTNGLDEAIVIRDHADSMECPGVIPMKIGIYKGQPALFMPLADGDLHGLIGTLTHRQAEHIINVLAKTLLCLSDIGLYYFDTKPLNIVYHCKNASRSTIYLADMSSVIPAEDGDYVATYPPPIDAKGDAFQGSSSIFGYVNIHKEGILDKRLALQIYTYQLSALYCWLVTPGADELTGPPRYTHRHGGFLAPDDETFLYYTQLMQFIKKYAKTGGGKNKYYKTLVDMFTDTKTPTLWSLDNIVPLDEFCT
jgi:hypothetical protein